MVTQETPDFLDASRKFKLFSDSIEVKLPRSREERDKKLLESLELTKEMTAIISQIFHAMHFIKDEIETAVEYKDAISVQEYRSLIAELPKLRETVQNLLQKSLRRSP